MAKKDFKTGLDALIGGGEDKKQPTAPRKEREASKPSHEENKENDTRATFIMDKELLEKVKDIAYWERALIKEVVEEAFREYAEKYEKKNGSIEPRGTK